MNQQATDQRRRGRYLILDAQHRVVLSVKEANGRVSECLVKDVSPFGLGVRAAEPSQPGGPIRIRYRNGGGSLEVLGYVVWCKASPGNQSVDLDSHPFRWGISFDPIDRQACDALYSAIREQSA